MAKIKVLFDAGRLSREMTGVGYYIKNLVETMAEDYKDEIELTGFYLNFLGQESSPPVIAGVKYKKIRWFSYKFLYAARRLKFRVPLNLVLPSAFKYDLVLFPDFIALPVLGPPSAVIIYDLCFMDRPELVLDINAKVLQRFVPPSVAAASGVIGISEFTKDRIIANFKNRLKGTIAVAPPGLVIKPQAVKSNAKTQPILFVGTIEPRKNVEGLLNAYEKLPVELQQKHPLILVGGVGWKSESILQKIEELKARGLPVIHKGYVSDAEKEQLYVEAGVVVLVSHYEGFGMPILEAMINNKPLLLSDIPVFKEVAGNAATYCDPIDPNDIAKKLEEVLAEDDSYKLKQYPAILSNYSWSKSAAAVVELIKQIGGE